MFPKPQEFFDAMAGGEPSLLAEFPLHPIGAPGMPDEGPDFRRLAAELAGIPETSNKKEWNDAFAEVRPWLEYLYRQALYDPNFSLPVLFKHNLTPAPFAVGHLWDGEVAGPLTADVMVIGKHPGVEELQHHRNFVGKGSADLYRALAELRLPEEQTGRWYLTNVVRHNNLDPARSQLPKEWLENCLPLLHQELRLVRPKFILCCGAEATKAILGRGATVTGLYGQVRELTYRVDTQGPAEHHTAQVMSIVHPAYVARKPEAYADLVAGLAQFWSLTQGERTSHVETDIDHRVLENVDQLRAVVDAAIADPDPRSRIIAVDAEWHGNHPADPASYLRTIQFSYRSKQAFLVALRGPKGVPIFQPNPEAAIPELRRLLLSTPERPVRVGGQFFRADLPWLLHAGIDLRQEWGAPTSPEAYRTAGGWDTGYMAHAVMESLPSYKLELLAVRFTGAPRYDLALQEWKDQYCRENHLKDKELEGYGLCPTEVLHAYACLDGESRVILADDTPVKISDLVRKRYSGKVKALVDGRVVAARVTGWHRHDVQQKEWFQLITAGTLQGRYGPIGPSFTPDHEIVTQRGKVRVDALVPGEDCVATEWQLLSGDQLSVFLGSLLGDGGFMSRNSGARVGFGFGQTARRGDYSHWKAAALAPLRPRRLRSAVGGSVRYTTPFSPYVRWLSQQYRTHAADAHANRKAVITPAFLRDLGPAGLAVWYQDDGTLVRGRGTAGATARIYAKLPPEDAAVAVAWLTGLVGCGVTYNRKNRFIQIGRQAADAFFALVSPFMCDVFAYKTPFPVGNWCPAGVAAVFHDPVLAVVPRRDNTKRGRGVRYCLTVPEAGNFLTSVGFVSNCYDADVTRRLYDVFEQMLHQDAYGNDCWEAAWHSQIAATAFLEMEMTGLPIDRRRVDDLTSTFQTAIGDKLGELQRAANWPDFNASSSPKCRELLFGPEYNGSLEKKGVVKLVRPDGAITLGLKPVKTTGKGAKEWDRVVADRETHIYAPSCDKEVLGILMQQHPIAGQLRDVRFLQQVLRGPLRRPLLGVGGSEITEDDGFFIYDGGFMRYLDYDGRVRTHFYPVETGRCSSSRPNIQNAAKRREDDYRRILQDRYQHPIRSIFRASPGHVLIECDLKSAEVAALGWLADDPTMIEHVRRNCLPEDHPDYLDIHSNMAVRAFRLDCAPTKKALKELGRPGLRVAAKNLVFGIPYGRGGIAIVRQCKEEGTEVTLEDVERIQEQYFATYSRTEAYFEECMSRVVDPGWLCGTYGRYRRFPQVEDEKLLAEQQRSARNFPIQNAVADAITVAMYNLQRYRRRYGEPHSFRMVLQIHDALLFEVPYQYVEWFVEEVVPACIAGVPLWPRHLDGKPFAHIHQPYHFGVDTELFDHWGEPFPYEHGLAVGIPAPYLHKPK